MSLTTEEKELKKITDAFSKAVKLFHKKEFKNAAEMFGTIIEEYKDSEYYSVLEIQTRSKTFMNLADVCQNPPRMQLKTDDDYLSEAVFQLNAGNFERSLQLCNALEEKRNFKDPYLAYITALCHLNNGDEDASLKYLKKCVDKDPSYKVIAHNEPDFEPLLEKEDFLSLIE
jgi:hypothetical protein